MADKHDPTTEYNYEDIEPQDSDPVHIITDDSSQSLKDKLTNNSLLVSFISAIIIYLIFIAVKSFISTTDDSEDDNIVQIAPVEIPAVQPEKVQPAAVVKATSSDVEPAATPIKTVSNDDINDIKRTITTINKQKQDSDITLKNVASNVDSIGSQIDLLINTIADISTDLNTLKVQVNLLENPPVVEDIKPLDVYHLRAAVWGRAFIISQDNPNITITVKVDDELKDYGNITGIYPSEGVVTTSSGRNIIFSPDES